MSDYRNDRQVHFAGSFTGPRTRYVRERLSWWRSVLQQLFGR